MFLVLQLTKESPCGNKKIILFSSSELATFILQKQEAVFNTAIIATISPCPRSCFYLMIHSYVSLSSNTLSPEE